MTMNIMKKTFTRRSGMRPKNHFVTMLDQGVKKPRCLQIKFSRRQKLQTKTTRVKNQQVNVTYLVEFLFYVGVNIFENIFNGISDKR